MPTTWRWRRRASSEVGGQPGTRPTKRLINQQPSRFLGLTLGLLPFDAARLGAHVHGLAGDLAAAETGETSLVAGDILGFLAAAFMKL